MKYLIGNILRGWIEGEFKSHKEAEKILGERFTVSFPTSKSHNIYKGGREVLLLVYKENEFGYKQFLNCKLFEAPDFIGTDKEVIELTKKYTYYKGFTLNP